MTETGTDSDPVRFEREFITGPDFAARVTAAALRHVLLRPRLLIYVALLFVVIVIAAVSGGPSAGAVIVIPGAFIAFIVVVYGLTYVLGRRRTHLQFPVGSRFSVGFRANTMVVSSPDVTSELSYRLFRTAVRTGSFVVLRRRRGSGIAMYPSELFTAESLDFLSHKLAEAR
jgi:hypothetical protein